MPSENILDNRRGSVSSQISTASIFSRAKRSTEISGKTKLSLVVPNTKSKSLSKKKERRKSVLSIAERKTNSLQHESFKPKELQQENQWMDNVVNMFTLPVVKLHINDNKGILSKDKSIDRILNITLIVSVMLAGIASAALAQSAFSFGFEPTKIILQNDGTISKV